MDQKTLLTEDGKKGQKIHQLSLQVRLPMFTEGRKRKDITTPTFTDDELATFTEGELLMFIEGRKNRIILTFTEGEVPMFTEGRKRKYNTNVH